MPILFFFIVKKPLIIVVVAAELSVVVPLAVFITDFLMEYLG